MTATIRDTAYQLRQGQLIALADETGWSIAADPTSETAVEKLLAFRSLMPAGLLPTVLIQNTDQLGMYVARMPDIAYDLVEFAEIPLTVIYDQGKSVSMRVWAAGQQNPLPATTNSLSPVDHMGNRSIALPGELAVRRSLTEEVQRLIGSFGRGLLILPLESLTLPKAIVLAVAEQFGVLPGMPKRPRIMRLKANGEVSFIRK